MSDKEEERKDTEEVKTLIKNVERDTAKYLIGVLQAIVKLMPYTKKLELTL